MAESSKKINEVVRVLGVDPGVATTGWAIVDFTGNDLKVIDYGVISTEKNLPLSKRLVEIEKDLIELIKKHKPTVSGLENLLFCNNAKTAIAVGQARGIVLLTLEKFNQQIYEFTPLQVKNIVSGYGQAEKLQIRKIVQNLAGFKDLPKSDDAADAVAIAICTYEASRGRISDNI